LPINLYYWRDKTGHEIDVIIDEGKKITPVETKRGMTISSEYFKNLTYWKKLSGVNQSLVLYAGDQNQKKSDGTEVINWLSYFIERKVFDLL